MYLQLCCFTQQTSRIIKACCQHYGLLSKMLATNHRLDHEIQNYPLENPKMFKKMNFQLMPWNRDENLVREFDHIQKTCQDIEDMTSI